MAPPFGSRKPDGRPGSPLVGIYSVLEDGTPLDPNGWAWNVMGRFFHLGRPKRQWKIRGNWFVHFGNSLISQYVLICVCVNRPKSPSFISDSRGHKMDAVFKRARITIPHATMLTMEFLTQRLHHCISSKIYQGVRWMFLFGHLFLWCLRGTCSKPWIYGSYVRFEELQSPVSQCHGTFQNRFLSTVVCSWLGSNKTQPLKDSHGILIVSLSLQAEFHTYCLLW